MKNKHLFFVASAVLLLCLTISVCLGSWLDHSTLSVTPSATVAQDPSGKLNINTATVAQLENLPGIGEKLAKAIVAYRKENGNFKSIGELTNVPGLGSGKLEEIVDLITVGG